MTERYTRSTVPTEYADHAKWTPIDIDLLDEAAAERAGRLQRAITAYLDGMPLRTIAAECKVNRSTVLRTLNRCLTIAPDHRLMGWRALLPFLRLKPYTRLTHLPEGRSSKGFAGAFSQFLARHGFIRDALDQYIDTRRNKDLPKDTRFTRKSAYNVFTRLCAEKHIGSHDYPFNVSDRGRRALSRYVTTRLRTKFSVGAHAEGGKNAATKSQTGSGRSGLILSNAFLDAVSVDAHRLDFIGTIEVPTGSGSEFIPISRMLFIPVVEHEFGPILGYRVAIRREATALDAVRAIQHALSRWTPRDLILPGLKYPKDGMLPSALPKGVGLLWSAILFDNATIHYSEAISNRLHRVTGCAVNWGPFYKWYRRGLVEALFSALERRGFHRMPNSTGTGPADPLRPNAVKNAVDLQITWRELLDLIDLMVCEYNVTPRETPYGLRSPLELCREALENKATPWLPRRLPSPNKVAALDTLVIKVTVRGNLKDGRRPYVNLWNAVYASPILADMTSMIGRHLFLHVRETDLRTVRAYLPNGGELGILTARGGWGRTRHDRSLRSEIIRETRSGTFVCPENEDVVDAFLRCKQIALNAKRGTKEQKTPKISQEATTIARILHDANVSVRAVQPTLDKKDPGKTQVTAKPSRPLPKFAPTISHRGITR